jgi:hypothetical protein
MGPTPLLDAMEIVQSRTRIIAMIPGMIPPPDRREQRVPAEPSRHRPLSSRLVAVGRKIYSKLAANVVTGNVDEAHGAVQEIFAPAV